ncbi:MAG: CCA tRNA nucleotidyltransferase [Candidatus Woesearchaeota archaeon]
MKHQLDTIKVQGVKNINNTNKILLKVKREITPEKTVVNDVDVMVKKINDTIKNLSIDADCIKGGSIAKDTFLKKDHDVDLFVRFASKYNDEEFSNMLEKILYKTLKKTPFQRVHGSRDYFQFEEKKLSYEIVPVLRIHKSNFSDARNITDFTPFHVEWTGSKINKNPELSSEIRLTKQFCKANNVYGAESYINGFSGHIIDILVIHYGSFLSVIKKFSSITEKDLPIIIDPEKQLSNPLKELNKSKITPLIIIDPVQKERNAAAALNKEKLFAFVDACKTFLNAPSIEFFKIRPFNMQKIIHELKKKSKRIICIDISTHIASKDIMGTKVLKIFEDIKKQCELEGFKIADSNWSFDSKKMTGIIILGFEEKNISEYIERIGPPISVKADFEKFKNKHDKTYIRGNKIYAKVKRKYTLPEKFVKDLIEKQYIKERAKNITISNIL